MNLTRARGWHLLTAVVAVVGVVVQLALVVAGESVLVQEDPPGLVERLYRFFAYFTIQSKSWSRSRRSRWLATPSATAAPGGSCGWPLSSASS